ncbi:CWF19-like protein 2 [Pectinophora gossypiella]|uniref:CWF19-like protein 2 n=1 Tax=Pectinophora gossypiella TaxID=13191 RepID=UPI00214EB783|nr:CWF19-like protein 2 [Pectinophora gossypiella]
MKEKRKKEKKHSKKHKRDKESRNKKRRESSSSSSGSESDVWVESLPTAPKGPPPEREDWMAMTGMLKTYTKEDVKPKREEKDKKHIDSYNPATSSRELNPYWKDGGTGVPQTPEEFRKSRPFVKPADNDDYYRSSQSSSYVKATNDKDDYRSLKSRSFIRPNEDDAGYYKSSKAQSFVKPSDDDNYYRSSGSKEYRPNSERSDRDYHSSSSSSRDKRVSYGQRGSGSWRRQSDSEKVKQYEEELQPSPPPVETPVKAEKPKDSKYLSDEKMNKLAAKLVKAEIMGDTKVVEDLKAKLEAAREYRKQNPDAGKEEEDDRVMLIATNSAGNSRPLMKSEKGDPRSKGGKRKADTHDAGQRNKYFGNDDKYNLAQMFQQEKYGNNYDDEAQLARIAAKSKNPNDDLEDIFVDEISKNRNEAKDAENEKQRAINQHVKMEKSLEGCEYCVGSKNMLKHLMVTMGNKIYLALPAKQSLVKGHCIITTIQHSTCVTSLDEDVWDEIMNFRRVLTQFFNSQNQDVVFFETATRLHKYPHMVINCIPLPRDVGDMASIYFKKALLECEAEWSMNKKVVDLKGKNIRKGVPKGLPYFWIDFGMDPGFAHVIEDQQLFPRNFAEEIIGGMLDLDHQLWKNPRKDYGDLQRKKVLEFLKEWKPFDEMIQKK